MGKRNRQARLPGVMGCLALPFIIVFGLVFLLPSAALLSLRFALSLIFFRNTPAAAKALAWRGAMCEHVGNSERAEYFYREAGFIASKYNTEASKRLHLLQTLNLGVVQRSNGKLQEAKRTLEGVAYECKAAGMIYLRLLTLQQLSLLHQELGDSERAKQYGEEMSALPLDSRLLGTGWTSPTALRVVLPQRLLMLDVDVDRKVRWSGSLAGLVIAATNAWEAGLVFSLFLGMFSEVARYALRNPQNIRQRYARLENMTESLDSYDDAQGMTDVEPSSPQNESPAESPAHVTRDFDSVLGSILYEDRLSRMLPAHETGPALIAQDGRRYLENGDLIKAKDYCLAAARMAELRIIPTVNELVYYHLGAVCSAFGETNLALDNFGRAIECIEAVRHGLLAEGLKLQFLGARARIYEDAVLCALGINVERAFELSERARSRAFLDMVGERLASLQPPVASEKERNKLRQLQASIETLGRQCVRLYNIMRTQQGWKRLTTMKRQAAFVGQLRRLRSQYEELHRRLQAQDQEWASFFQVVTANADEVRQYMDNGTVLLEYYVTESKTVVFSSSVDRGLIATTLDISRRELKAEVDAVTPKRWIDVSARLAAGDSDIFKETQKVLSTLYQLLIAPLEQHLEGVKKLIIVPHGILHYVPFHALFQNGNYLIDYFEVCYAPSASVLQSCRTKARRKRKSCLIIANPTGDLVYAQEEARAVSQFFEHVVLLPSNGEPANVINVIQRMPYFDVIHFACHGQFDSDAPMASFLQLSPTAGDPGLLTVSRLYDLQMSCSLVTLSACETGVSKVLSGDELIGLVRGFLFAGAPSVLVSLWSVDDRSTSELMARFYQGYVSNGESKSAALRHSILEVKANESTSHPYFWAPFCLVGETI